MSLVPLSPVSLPLYPLYLCPYLSLSDALGVLVAGDGILVGERERAFRPSGCPVFACFCLDISSSYKPQPPLIALSAGHLPPLIPLLLEPHDPFPSYALSIFRIDYTTTPLASPP